MQDSIITTMKFKHPHHGVLYFYPCSAGNFAAMAAKYIHPGAINYLAYPEAPFTQGVAIISPERGSVSWGTPSETWRYERECTCTSENIQLDLLTLSERMTPRYDKPTIVRCVRVQPYLYVTDDMTYQESLELRDGLSKALLPTFTVEEQPPTGPFNSTKADYAPEDKGHLTIHLPSRGLIWSDLRDTSAGEATSEHESVEVDLAELLTLRATQLPVGWETNSLVGRIMEWRGAPHHPGGVVFIFHCSVKEASFMTHLVKFSAETELLPQQVGFFIITPKTLRNIKAENILPGAIFFNNWAEVNSWMEADTYHSHPGALWKLRDDKVIIVDKRDPSVFEDVTII